MIDELMWRITFRCNKHCAYCFNEVFEDRVNHLCEEKKDVDYLTSFVKKFEVSKVYISGGEPAVVDGLKEIIERIAMHARVIIFTNGLLFERYTIDVIGKMPLDAVNVTIDIGDILENTHHFKKLMKLFKDLRAINSTIKINVQIMIDNQYFEVINSNGYKSLNMCVNRILWQPLTVPASCNLYEQTLEGMPSEQANKIVCDLMNRSQGEMFEHICNLKNALKDLGPKECKMGKKYITMNPDMSISLCPHINNIIISEEELIELIKSSSSFRCDKFSIRCFSLYSHLLRRFPTQ